MIVDWIQTVQPFQVWTSHNDGGDKVIVLIEAGALRSRALRRGLRSGDLYGTHDGGKQRVRAQSAPEHHDSDALVELILLLVSG